jgi:hypothetical protein
MSAEPKVSNKVECSCGALVDRRGQHLQSPLHRDRARWLEIIGQPGLTYKEIGKRLGISKQRVQYIVAQLRGDDAVSGREMLKARTKRRRVQTALQSGELLYALSRKCIFHGLKLDFVHGHHKVKTREVLVNSTHCLLLRMFWRCRGGEARYLCINAPKRDRDYDYVIYWEATDDIWLVIPKKAMPRARTMFSLEDPVKRGCLSYRHDYREYLSAWRLLSPMISGLVFILHFLSADLTPVPFV